MLHEGLNSAPPPGTLVPFSSPPPGLPCLLPGRGLFFLWTVPASTGLWVGQAPTAQTHRWAHLFHAWRVCGLRGAIGVGGDVGSERPGPGGGSLAVRASYSVGSSCGIHHLLSPPGMNPHGLTTGWPGAVRWGWAFADLLLFVPSESRRPHGGLAGTGHGLLRPQGAGQVQPRLHAPAGMGLGSLCPGAPAGREPRPGPSWLCTGSHHRAWFHCWVLPVSLRSGHLCGSVSRPPSGREMERLLTRSCLATGHCYLVSGLGLCLLHVEMPACRDSCTFGG